MQNWLKEKSKDQFDNLKYRYYPNSQLKRFKDNKVATTKQVVHNGVIWTISVRWSKDMIKSTIFFYNTNRESQVDRWRE